MKKHMTPASMITAMDICYNHAIEGFRRVIPPLDMYAEQFAKKEKHARRAAVSMLKVQIAKCGTSGFVTGLGGIFSMPVTLPANLGSVLYMQMRMAAGVAYLAGYDINSDQVKTMVYACIAGVSREQFMEMALMNVGEKLARKNVEKIPRQILMKINEELAARLIVKFAEESVANIGSMIPVLGAVVNGSFDTAETTAIGKRALEMWFA